VTGRLALTKKFQQDSILDQMFGKANMYKLDMKNVEEYQFKLPDNSGQGNIFNHRLTSSNSAAYF